MLRDSNQINNGKFLLLRSPENSFALKNKDYYLVEVQRIGVYAYTACNDVWDKFLNSIVRNAYSIDDRIKMLHEWLVFCTEDTDAFKSIKNLSFNFYVVTVMPEYKLFEALRSIFNDETGEYEYNLIIKQ